MPSETSSLHLNILNGCDLKPSTPSGDIDQGNAKFGGQASWRARTKQLKLGSLGLLPVVLIDLWVTITVVRQAANWFGTLATALRAFHEHVSSDPCSNWDLLSY